MTYQDHFTLPTELLEQVVSKAWISFRFHPAQTYRREAANIYHY